MERWTVLGAAGAAAVVAVQLRNGGCCAPAAEPQPTPDPAQRPPPEPEPEPESQPESQPEPEPEPEPERMLVRDGPLCVRVQQSEDCRAQGDGADAVCILSLEGGEAAAWVTPLAGGGSGLQDEALAALSQDLLRFLGGLPATLGTSSLRRELGQRAPFGTHGAVSVRGPGVPGLCVSLLARWVQEFGELRNCQAFDEEEEMMGKMAVCDVSGSC